MLLYIYEAFGFHHPVRIYPVGHFYCRRLFIHLRQIETDFLIQSETGFIDIQSFILSFDIALKCLQYVATNCKYFGGSDFILSHQKSSKYLKKKVSSILREYSKLCPTQCSKK